MNNRLISGLGSIATGMIVAVLVIVGVVGYMMFTNDSNDVVMETETAETGSSMMGDESMMEDVRVVEVEGGSFYFEPNEITVKRGETVKIVLNSVDKMHDFVVDELGVRTPIVQGGDSAEVEFTATEPGTYEFYCSVGSHREQGMVGTLIVE